MWFAKRLFLNNVAGNYRTLRLSHVQLKECVRAKAVQRYSPARRQQTVELHPGLCCANREQGV